MPRSRRLGLLAAIAIPALVFTPCPWPAADAARGHPTKLDRHTFHDSMRKLWRTTSPLTRLFIVSAATLPDALPDIGPTTERLH